MRRLNEARARQLAISQPGGEIQKKSFRGNPDIFRRNCKFNSLPLDVLTTIKYKNVGNPLLLVNDDISIYSCESWAIAIHISKLKSSFQRPAISRKLI